MKWVAASLVVLAAGWLVVSQKEGGQNQGEGAEVASSRRVLGTAWRSGPEREMTISEMERYAGGLSDEELEEEMITLSQRWLEQNAGLKIPAPPRLILILARSAGKRFGEESLSWLHECLDASLTSHEKTNKESLKTSINTLMWQLKAAVFGGWLEIEPVPAMEDYLDGWDEYENYGFAGYQDSLFEFFRRRMAGDALERLAGDGSERAFELLREHHRKLPVLCIELTTSFLKGVPEARRAEWLGRVGEAWPHLRDIARIPFVPLAEVKGILIAHPQISWYEIDQFVEKLDQNDLKILGVDPAMEAKHRVGIIIELIHQGGLSSGDLLDLPVLVQEGVLRWLSAHDDVPGWDSVGPVEAKEISRNQDQRELVAQLEEVIPLSALATGQKAELLEILDERKILLNGTGD